jgi:hypothetical protein
MAHDSISQHRMFVKKIEVDKSKREKALNGFSNNLARATG